MTRKIKDNKKRQNMNYSAVDKRVKLLAINDFLRVADL